MDIKKEFQKNRDIPYSIPLSDKDVDNCCGGKVRRLKKVLDGEGYETRYRVCDFNWSDLGLPRNLLSISHDDLSMHVYLEVKAENKWIDVDPTWDKGLKSVFEISEWDGASSTVIAVKPLKLYSPEESEKIMLETSDDSANIEFFKALNEWLENIRSAQA